MEDNKFKNSMGGFYLKQLFYETTLADKSTVVYTLKDRDHEGFPSLYKLYMGMEDVTEYEFANTYLDSWTHWQRLSEATWFKPYIERWREELRLKLLARHLNMIKKKAEGDDKSSLEASKYLIEQKWSKDKVGRPSKEAIKEKAHELWEHEKAVLEDFNSITRN
jgi:hypothetical protein